MRLRGVVEELGLTAVTVGRHDHAPGDDAGGLGAEVPAHHVQRQVDAGVLEWARAHLDGGLSVAVLASRARRSERTFARRFKEATATTPFRWVLTQRVQRAQELLETSDVDVDHVAARAGFGTAANLREHFRELQTTRSAYRRSFGGARGMDAVDRHTA